MFKVILIFVLCWNTYSLDRLPKALTIYNEYKDVFAFSSKKFLKDALLKNHAIFKGGCSFRVLTKVENYPCRKEELNLRAQSIPASNRVYHLKIYEICRELALKKENLDFFKKRFSLGDYDRDELKSLHLYFYPLLDEGNVLDKIVSNIEHLSKENKLEALFVTYCSDPGWL